jgi:hypothetical protein
LLRRTSLWTRIATRFLQISVFRKFRLVFPARRSLKARLDGTLQRSSPKMTYTGRQRLMCIPSDPFVLKWVHASCLTSTAYQIQAYTGSPPFSSWNIYQVIAFMQRGGRPSRPLEPSPQGNTISNGIWSIMESCWDSNPAARPKAAVVVEMLAQACDLVS